MPSHSSRSIVHWQRKWRRRWPVYVMLLLFCVTCVAVAFLVLNGNDSPIESASLPQGS